MDKLFDFVEMKIPAKPEYVGVVRLTVSGIASRMGYYYDVIEDLKVAVSEACTNAVQHAYSEKEDGEVTIGFGIYEDRLEVMVADHGKSFDLERVYEELGPYNGSDTVEDLNEGGLGIYLIDTLMDSVKINSKSGVIVLMTKYLHKDGVNNDGNQTETSFTQS